MKNTKDIVDSIRHLLEEAAFLVSKTGEEKTLHKSIINALVLLGELDMTNEQATTPADEVNKVIRKLKRWARNTTQINSRILMAYLTLEHEGKEPITEDALRTAFADSSFDTNFVQMKNIASKNHGKVFEQTGDIITIWPPVLSAVREFERIVFPNV